MALQILNAGDRPNAEELLQQIRSSIKEAIPGAQVEVSSGGSGHYELRVVSEAFADKRRVAQQQLVYGAIAHLMAGNDAPIHAIDRMECVVPETPGA
jgi:acid stress-induced BolA-like protein IbaG/YrbA